MRCDPLKPPFAQLGTFSGCSAGQGEHSPLHVELMLWTFFLPRTADHGGLGGGQKDTRFVQIVQLR
jgi:hypothetical protein